MEDSIKKWLENWFVENLGIEMNAVLEETKTNFFHNGWMDSFQFINLISDVEEQFKVTFLNDEFQDRSFASIHGMTKSISEKVNTLY